MVSIGKKGERVALQSSSISGSDTYGDVNSISWATVGTYWAEVKPIRASEFLAQERTKSVVTHRFIFRYNAALGAAKPEDRLVWNGNNYYVTSAPDLPTSAREVEILTEVRS